MGAASETEIIFTSCGSESNSAAIRSALSFSGSKREIITTSIEHSSIRKLCQALGKEGYFVREIGVDSNGRLNMAEFKEALSPQTALVTMMMANNETGNIFPVEEIGLMVKQKGIPFHVDAVQAAAKIALNVKNLPVDFLSISAHKFNGPKGVGALYIRSGVPFKSFIIGGGQERGRRAGTENVASIVGLGMASELAVQNFETQNRHVELIRNKFEKMIQEKIPNISINGGTAPRLPNTSNIQFHGVDGEAMLLKLDQHWICASSGSACTSGSREPSHVLLAMGLDQDQANSSVRFSFGAVTSESDIADAVAIIVQTVEYLRSGEYHPKHSKEAS